MYIVKNNVKTGHISRIEKKNELDDIMITIDTRSCRDHIAASLYRLDLV